MAMSSSSADHVIELYQRYAASWIRLRGASLIEKSWLDAFLKELPENGRDVLDIGCGSGVPIANYLIGKGCRLTGIDGAAALIEHATQGFPDHTWILGDMRKLPDLGRFDGLVAWHSFFHLCPEDQRPMFETFRRLASPGAPLLFTSGTVNGEAIGSFEGQPLYHGSLDSSEYRELLRCNGFETLRHTESDPTCGGATVWLAKRVDCAD